MSDPVWPHGLQQARCPCPSPVTSQVKQFIQWPRIAESFPKEEKSDLKEKQNATLKLVFLQNEGYLMSLTPVLWPPHVKSWLIGKDSDAERDWGQEEKGMTEDEMAGWHHWLDGHEFEWTLGVGDVQGGPACCVSWGRKELDMTEWLNWNELNLFKEVFKRYKIIYTIWWFKLNKIKMVINCYESGRSKTKPFQRKTPSNKASNIP